MQLLLATQNTGKRAEFLEILEGIPQTLVLPQDVGLGAVDVPETGTTLEENATLKARAFAEQSGLFALADDSGLFVDALDGAPGIYTARYGGEGLTMPERRQRLLAALADVPEDARTAQFRCVITLANPKTLECTSVLGVCAGHIAFAESGGGGFGYDPIFIPAGYTLTFAEIPQDTKHRISHRGVALAKIRPLLAALTDE